MPCSEALILFGHGARDPEWAIPLQAIQGRVRGAHPGVVVEMAFLEFMSPNLSERVGELVAQGIGRITVLPMFIAQGGHLKRELPGLVEALRGQYPEVDIVLTPAIGSAEAVIAAMADQAGLYLDFRHGDGDPLSPD